ncbi:hypothetical protein ACFWZY_01635 [Streptomyces sp. NPDC058992]|uniref:hypothetical protein n=1 Tax=Streptomyces sp. NPDC058992 TaxID=3346688 RepID=UPI00368C69CE
MHAAFAALAALAMLASFSVLARLAPAPARLDLALALGFIAGCALSAALAAAL